MENMEWKNVRVFIGGEELKGVKVIKFDIPNLSEITPIRTLRCPLCGSLLSIKDEHRVVISLCCNVMFKNNRGHLEIY